MKASWIWLGVIGQSGQIVHTGIQCQRDSPALFKGHIALTAFDFGVIALVNAGQHLHFYLSILSFFSQFPQMCHIITKYSMSN